MFERFTERARKVMALANQEAQRLNHAYLGTEHILLGLGKEGAGAGANVLKNLDVDLRKVRLEVDKFVSSGPDAVSMGKLPQTPRAKKVIEYAIEEARSLNHNYIGTEHLLLGLLRESDGVAAQVLMNLGLELDETRDEIYSFLGGTAPAPRPTKPRQPKRQPDPLMEGIRRFGHHSEAQSLFAKYEAARNAKNECVKLGRYERAAAFRDEADTYGLQLVDLFKRLSKEEQK